MDTRVGVGMFRVSLAAEHENGRVDLDRVHVPRPAAQSGGDIIAGTRANDRDVLWLFRDLVRQVVIISSFANDRMGRQMVGAIQKIVNSLVIVTSSTDFHPTVIVVSYLKQLVRRIDPL